MDIPHKTIEPSILYFGTPVVLVSTVNEDETFNLAPMSSAWWLGWRCMLGLGNASQTPINLRRTRECVLNLPSVEQVRAVNALARLTGTPVVPESKRRLGYTYEPDKFGASGLTPIPSETVGAPRALECPIQLEATLISQSDLMSDDPAMAGFFGAYEVRIKRVHVHPDLIVDGYPNRIDPAKWRPLIMSFQKFFGLAGSEAGASKLAAIDEELYRSPDVDRARGDIRRLG